MKCIISLLLLTLACTAVADGLGSRAPVPPLSPFDAKVRKTFEKADRKGTLDDCYELILSKIPINNPSRAVFNQTVGVYDKGGRISSSWAFTQVVATLRMRSVVQRVASALSTLALSAFMVRVVSYHVWMNLDLLLGSVVDFIPFLDFAVIDSEVTLQVILTIIFFYNVANLLMGAIKTLLWLNEDKIKKIADAANGVTVDPPVYYTTPPLPPRGAATRASSSSSSTMLAGKMVLGAGAAAAAGLLATMDSETINSNINSLNSLSSSLSSSINSSIDSISSNINSRLLPPTTKPKNNKKASSPKKKKQPPAPKKKKVPPPPPVVIIPQKLVAPSGAAMRPPPKKKVPPPPPPKKKVPPPPPKKKKASPPPMKKKIVAKKPNTNKVLEGNEFTAGAKARGAVAAGVVVTMGSLY